jgi:predicted SprT family Zn-dependent metalloprotease
MRMYRKVVKLLRSKFPPKWPLNVRRCKLSPTLDGDCQFKTDHFLIRINRDLQEHEAIETLLHEFAHTHAWDVSTDMHSDEWGRAYSRVYRVFLKEFIDNTI